ncbi:MAG: MBL fold metallo-hydrolase [Bacteroidia bacterium]|nr:MBL fold metallo-hydrolase [Bacteroidia bacterium]
MKIIVLSDNRTINSELETEHGLCVYLETAKYKCLLDTGASDIFVRNAAKLNVDLSEVDYVFISHGHADHIGGLPFFLKLNSKAKIVMSENALSQTYYSVRNGLHRISIDFDVEKIKERLVLVNKDAWFESDIHVFSVHELKNPLPQGNRTLLRDAGTGVEPDDFNHEIVVTFGTDNLFVFTGCGHKGLLNILDTLKSTTLKRIRYVMGGFHLLDAKNGILFESEQEIEKLAKSLIKDYPHTEFITGHCTGEHTYEILKKTLEYKLIHFFTGYRLEMW